MRDVSTPVGVLPLGYTAPVRRDHGPEDEFWISQHDNNMLNQQAETRVHRPGHTDVANRVRIVPPGTVDAKVYPRLSENAQMMREADRKDNPR